MSYTRPQIDAILTKSDRAVERAIIRLFELQTQNEQRVAHTTHQNDEGFCACDAKAGTRFARWILGMNDRNQSKFPAKPLTHPRASRIFGRYCKGGERPIDRARRIALKHSKQLVNIANAKAEAAAAPELNLSKEETGVKDEYVPVDVTKYVPTEEEEQAAYDNDAQQRHSGKKVRECYDRPTNEQLAAEMAAESYGAAGGNQEEYYQRHLARLNKEDDGHPGPFASISQIAAYYEKLRGMPGAMSGFPEIEREY
jgi:hypothetical protein